MRPCRLAKDAIFWLISRLPAENLSGIVELNEVRELEDDAAAVAATSIGGRCWLLS